MRWTLLMVLWVMLLPAALSAQRRGRRGFEDPAGYERYNTTYDGRFVFLRLRYEPRVTFSRGDGFFGGGDAGWAHDYPTAERNLTKLLSELTLVRPFLEGGNIHAADSPEIFKYPVAYLSEPGYWSLNEAEAANLRAYLLKGGFLIVDDFEGAHWFNFEEKMRQVLPGAAFVRLDPSYPVFHSFFDIESLDHLTYGNYRSEREPAVYYGIFEDNDPQKRLIVIANYNNDIGDYWEWSDQGFFPIELSNEAYKLGINYIVYAMTH